jgi:orotidine-5'-phosphate decarboxylase
MPAPRIDAKDRLIVALDIDIEDARKLIDNLDGLVDFFKIGLSLQLAEGIDNFITELLARRKRVFLDYKYYDVPETMTKAVARASKRGVTFLTVHGSSNLMKTAVQAKAGTSLKLFTVTVLTSMDAEDIGELGYTNHTVEQLVLFRARKALEAGCDGVIASGLEAKQIKELAQANLLVVTPGIREGGYPADDQKRRTTARDAVLAGADYLVVGRPIYGSDNPREKAKEFLAEMQDAFDSRSTTAPA